MKDKNKKEETEYISLFEAAKISGYAQDYLSLLCRQGKLKGEKIGRNWVTTYQWLDEYQQNLISDMVSEKKSIMPKKDFKQIESIERIIEKKNKFLKRIKVPKIPELVLATSLFFLILLGGFAYAKNPQFFSDFEEQVYQAENQIAYRISEIEKNVSNASKNIYLVSSETIKIKTKNIYSDLADVSESINSTGEKISDNVISFSDSFRNSAGAAKIHLAYRLSEIGENILNNTNENIYSRVNAGKSIAMIPLQVGEKFGESVITYSIKIPMKIGEAFDKGFEKSDLVLNLSFEKTNLAIKDSFNDLSNGIARLQRYSNCGQASLSPPKFWEGAARNDNLYISQLPKFPKLNFGNFGDNFSKGVSVFFETTDKEKEFGRVAGVSTKKILEIPELNSQISESSTLGNLGSSISQSISEVGKFIWETPIKVADESANIVINGPIKIGETVIAAADKTVNQSASQITDAYVFAGRGLANGFNNFSDKVVGLSNKVAGFFNRGLNNVYKKLAGLFGNTYLGLTQLFVDTPSYSPPYQGGVGGGISQVPFFPDSKEAGDDTDRRLQERLIKDEGEDTYPRLQNEMGKEDEIENLKEGLDILQQEIDELKKVSTGKIIQQNITQEIVREIVKEQKGEQGLAGPQGPVGATGPQGPVGTGTTIVQGGDAYLSGGNTWIGGNVFEGHTLMNSLGVSHKTSIGDDLSVGGTTTLGTKATDDLNVHASSNFFSPITVTNDITQSSGQVIFGGNVDATSGLDVTGADLTVGGTNFVVDVATGNISTTGDLTIAGTTTLGDASTDTIIPNAQFAGDLIPSTTSAYNLGSATNYWDSAYINNIVVGVTNIGGTTSESFILNTDNATADAEDIWMEFERGTAVPNAKILWSSGNTRFDFNFPVHLSGAGEISGPGAGGLTLTNDSGPLTVSTTSSGDLNLTSVDDLTLTAGTEVLTLGAGTNTIINTDADTAILINPNGTGAVQFHSTSNYIDASGNLILDGDITLTSGGTFYTTANGNLVFAPNGSGNLVIGETSNPAKIIPFADSTVGYDLGEATQRWYDLYLKNSIDIDSTKLDINSLDFVGLGQITTGASTDLTLRSGAGGKTVITDGTDYVHIADGTRALYAVKGSQAVELADGTWAIDATGDIRLSQDITITGGKIILGTGTESIDNETSNLLKLITSGDTKVVLGDNAGANQFQIADSDNNVVAYVDSDGNVSVATGAFSSYVQTPQIQTGSGDLTLAPVGKTTTTQNFETTGTGTITSAGLLTAQNGLTVSGTGNILFSTSGTINQSGSGQVTFSGNVDANAGLDVTGITNLGDGGTANYAQFSATGDLTFFDNSGGVLITGPGATGMALTNAGDLTVSTTSSGNLSVSSNGTLALSSSDWNITTTGVGTGFDSWTVDNIKLDGAVITSDTDAISFDNENISTTGTLGAGATTVTSLTNSGNIIFDLTNDVTIQATDPSGVRVYTIPDFGLNDSFVGLDATQTLTNKTLTAPIFADLGYIADANGNEMLIFDTTTSAVNHLTLANAATGNAPTLTVSGTDTNIDFDITPKGTGGMRLTTGGFYQPVYGTDDGLVGSWDFSEQIGDEKLTSTGLELTSDQSYTTTGTASETIDAVTNTKIAQKFVPTDKNIGQVILYQTAAGTIVGNVSIQADSAGSPDGTDIVSETGVTLNAGSATTVSFTPFANLTASNTYWLVFTATSGSGTFQGGTTGTADQVKYYAAAAWNLSATVENIYFYTYGQDNWQSFGDDSGAALRDVKQETATVYSGSNSVKIIAASNTADTDFGIQQTGISVKPSTTYQLNGWVDYDSRTNGSIKLEAITNGTSVTSTETLSATTSDFQFLSLRITTPADATTIDVKFYMDAEYAVAPGSSGTAYIDLLSLKEVSTTTYDNSEFGNDGTIVADTAGVGASFADGKYGQGMQFDGQDDYVDCGSDPSLINLYDSSFTIESWMKTNDNTDNWQGIVTDVDANKFISIWCHPGDDIYVYTYINGTDNQNLSTSEDLIDNDVWYYVVVTREKDTGVTKLYLDAVEKDSFTAIGTVGDQGSSMRIGYGAGGDFNGSLDGVKIYNRAISADEVKAHYLRGAETHTDLAFDTSSTAGKLYGNRIILDDTGAVSTGADTSYGQYISATRTGASGTADIDTYGIYSKVVGDTGGSGGTGSTTVAGYFSATGATNNYGLIVEDGNVGIGDSDPAALLTVGTSDAFQVDSSGNILTSGTTGLTFSGSTAGIDFSNNSTHIIQASSGTLQLNAFTLGGAITGSSQNVSGLGSLGAGAATITSLDVSTGGIIQAGAISGATSINASGTITGGTLTDGSFSVTSGNITGAGNLTFSGSPILKLGTASGNFAFTDSENNTLLTLTDSGTNGLLTVHTIYGTIFDTNVAAAGVTLTGTTLAADGTDTNIDIDITPQGTGEVNITKIDVDSGAIDGTAIGAVSPSTGAFTTLTATPATDASGLAITRNVASASSSLLSITESNSTATGTGLAISQAGTGAKVATFAGPAASGTVNLVEISGTTTGTGLTVTQSGTGYIFDLKDGANSIFTVADNGEIFASATTSGNPYSLIADEATTNLVLNPSFEYGTYNQNWTAVASATPSDSTTYYHAGTHSMKVVTPNSAADEGIQHAAISVSASTTYIGSVFLKGSGTAELSLTGDNSGATATNAINLTDDWTRYFISKTTDASDTTLTLKILTPTQQLATFYIDAVQLEAKSAMTTYCDGSLGEGYSWSSTAHNSTSSRTAGMRFKNNATGFALDDEGRLDVGGLTVSQKGSADGEIFRVSGGADSILSVNQAIVEVNQPFAVNVAGDTGINYDLAFLNTGSTFVTSAGPLTIAAGDPNHSENLTISTQSNLAGGDSGRATAGDTTTLTDSTKSSTWTANEWADGTISIVSGDGASQTQTVASNTTTVITVADWDSTLGDPDTNSYYTLAYARGGDVLVNASQSHLQIGGFKILGSDSGSYVFKVSADGDVEIGGSGLGGSDLLVKQNISLTGGNITIGQLDISDAGTITVADGATSGGDCDLGTNYYYVVVAVNDNGTTAYGGASVAQNPTGLNYKNQVTWSPVDGATGYKLYRNTDGVWTGGDEYWVDGKVISTLDTTYLDDCVAAGDTASQTPPTSNTTGGGITYPSTGGPKRSIILTAAGAVIPAANSPAQTKVEGARHTYYVLDFDADADEDVFWHWIMPDSYDAGNIDVTIYWFANNITAAQDVVWAVETAGIDFDELYDPAALGSTQTKTDGAFDVSAVNELNFATFTAFDPGWAAEDEIIFRVFRDADNGADDMTGDARLVKVKIEYSVSTESD